MPYLTNTMNKLLSLLLLLTSSITTAFAGSVPPQCQKLVPYASVEMVYIDVPTKEVEHYSKEVLKGLADKHAPNARVFGLTRGKPEVQYEVNRGRLRLKSGQVCVVPQVKIRATFSEMTVFLASELAHNPCKKRLIRNHEMEHVNTWKSHLKGGMTLLKAPLLAKFSMPRVYASKEAADADLRNWIVGSIDPMMQKLFKNITKAQLEIDSPMSYRTVLQALNTCPG